jgi:HAD superfamily hydrolase (TIGR01549 family)
MKAQRSNNPAILFDLDGTLIDSVYEHVIAWAVPLRTAGIVVPNWKIHRRIGMSGESMVRQLLREPEVDRRAVNVERLEDEHAAAFKKAASKIRLLPGVRELLRFLNQSVTRWAIATTGNRKQTESLLKDLKIPRPSVVTTGDDVRKAKPAPDVFVLAAKHLGVPIEDCIVVGDSPWDMLAAGRRRALGVGILAGGYSRGELEESGAFRVYADPAEMLLHIEDLGIAGES